MAGICGVAACGAAVQVSSQPRPLSVAPVDGATMARDIARIAMGNGGLAALDNGDGLATLAYCDPATVSGGLHVSSPVSASCGISYSDGSVWRQTVTATFDGHGGPAGSAVLAAERSGRQSRKGTGDRFGEARLAEAGWIGAPVRFRAVQSRRGPHRHPRLRPVPVGSPVRQRAVLCAVTCGDRPRGG